MYRDGICHGKDGRFSKTVRFYDINYQLAQNEDKASIFESWCDFLNYFDSSIHFQLSFINQHINVSEYQRMVCIPPCGDDFDLIRQEYTEMLQNQLAKRPITVCRKSNTSAFPLRRQIIQRQSPPGAYRNGYPCNFKVLGVGLRV